MKRSKTVGRVVRVAAAGAFVLGVLAPTAAFATDYPGPNTPSTPTDPGASVKGTTTTNSGGSLPFTGGDVAGLAAIGAGAALVGGTMVRHSRRARASA